MRIARKLLALAVVSLAATSVHAEGSYLGLGLGLQFNLADLGSAITKDGLDASTVGPNGVSTQQVIVPENKLDVLGKLGVLKVDQNSAMTGGILSAFWEKEGQNTFWRVGVDHTRKILGGHTTAEFIGHRMIDVTWSYQATHIPFYWGMKAGVGESASVYGGLGLHYYRGGWGIDGDSNGQLLYEVTNGLLSVGPHANSCLITGATCSVPVSRQNPNGGFPVIGEKVRFDVSGIGFNFLVGIERKLQSGNKTYFEIEYVIGGKMDNAPVRSPGTIQSLAATGSLSYPINLSGTRFKFGYKIPM
jgi:hypothetical protein